MTGIEGALIAFVLIVGFFTAWNIGANDVANAMGTSVGSGALTLRQAVIVAGIFEFLGAALVGANVSETVRKKMFDPGLLSGIHGDQAAVILALGMIAALLATGTWLMVASYLRWPVSTTHSIVGAVVGFGCVGVGFGNVDWAQVGLITAGWVVSPLLSGVIAYTLFRAILRSVFFKDNPVAAAKHVAPYLVFLVLIVLIGVAMFKGLNPLWARLSIDPFDPRIMLLMLVAASVAGFTGMVTTRRMVRDVPEAQVDTPNPVRYAELSRSLNKAAAHLQRVHDVADGPMNDQVATLLKNVEELKSNAQAQSRFGTDSTELQHVEKIFVYLQIFAEPARDARQAIVTGEVALQAAVPGWALAIGGLGIVASWAVTIPVGACLSIVFYYLLRFALLDSGFGG